MMSASDSDCSIDWLASDDDSDSVFESDCDRANSGRTLPLPRQHLCHAGDTREPCAPHSNCAPSESRRGCGLDKGSVPTCADSDQVYAPAGAPRRRDRSWDRRKHMEPLQGEQEGASSSSCPSLGRTERSPDRKRDRSLRDPEHREGGRASGSEQDRMFAHKCMELQCYIHPLSSILNGLRSGRYRQRLSSFQESVAMDRIQRIMGVLQNPCMGERYINIILQVEVMLKNWFPHVKPSDQRLDEETQDTPPSKKLKMSPSGMTRNAPKASPTSSCVLPPSHKAHRNIELPPSGTTSSTNLKWLHTSPICTPSVEHALGRLGHRAAARESDVTQDNAVSSSTDGRRPPPGKINAPCLERLLKATESIISHKGTGSAKETGCS
nr:PREDICTED: circadian-associated transcriptional repressor [Lepisosteus oculatus]XP_015198991.1 PREDICTED: circadian-associated transcriptional repressor [Lepisosteus oculatus]